jgi:hypothetical protein
MAGLRDKILELAAKEVGYKEGLNNANKFGEWFGLNNEPWCMIACSKIYADAGFILKHGGWLKGYASVPELYKQAKARGWLTNDPKPGDLVIYDWNGDKKGDHVGILKEKIPGFVIAYEGNTGDKDWSNGEGFYQPKRAMATVMAFVNVIDNIPSPLPTVSTQTEAELLFDKVARKHMSNWNMANYQKDFPTLFKVIIEALGIALSGKK